MLAAIAALLIAVPASAHVTAQPPEQVAGGFTTVTFRVPNERPEPTTKLEVQFPESITSARVKPVPGWSYDVKMVELDEPAEDSHGEEITERIGTITWTGGEVLDGEFQEFTVSVKMAEEGDLGDLVFFPTIQSYDGGEVVRWIQKPASADDDAELENPAPSVTLVEGDAHGASSDKGDKGDDADDHAAASGDDGEDEEDDPTTMALALIALALSVIAILIGWKGARRKRD